MTTFTSSLPDELLKTLATEAENLKIPKNRIIEHALKFYFDELKKARYAESFIRASKDKEMMDIAEEGLQDYFETLKRYEEQ